MPPASWSEVYSALPSASTSTVLPSMLFAATVVALAARPGSRGACHRVGWPRPRGNATAPPPSPASPSRRPGGGRDHRDLCRDRAHGESRVQGWRREQLERRSGAALG